MPLADRQAHAPALLQVRRLGNLINLSTPLGLAVAGLGRASVRRLPDGLWLAEHYRLRFPVAGAFTIGNVILTSGEWSDLERRYPKLFEHEEAHTWQYLYCLGLPYLACYTACLGWSVLTTGDRAAGHFFERRAGLLAGGYVERPRRSVGAGLTAALRAAGRTVSRG